MHPEALILAQVVGLLVAANTVAELRVFPTPKISIKPNELPAIAVFVLETDSEVRDDAPRSHMRTATMVVELRLQSGAEIDDVDDPMFAFRLQVENVLDYDRALLDGTENLTPTGVVTAIDASGDRVTSVAAMSYEVVYNQCAPPTAAAVALLKAQAQYNLDNAVHPDNQVTDCVELDGP